MVARRKSTKSQWPASLSSHDVWVPGETVSLSPFARVWERGQFETIAKSAIRALDILELLARTKVPLRAVEISSALGVSPSSTHQLLKSMMDSAYLIFDPASKRYVPSIRATGLGTALAYSTHAPDALNRLVEELGKASDATLTMSARQGQFMQLIEIYGPPGEADRIVTRNELRVNSMGMRVPIFGSCTGAAWLSAQTDQAILTTARLCRRALGSQADDAQTLLGMADRIRQQGYAYGGITADDSTRAIAVPLPPDASGCVYVMALTAATEEMAGSRGHVAEVLKDHIARYLGPGAVITGKG